MSEPSIIAAGISAAARLTVSTILTLIFGFQFNLGIYPAWTANVMSDRGQVL